jgi:hypothetical protein
MEHDATTGLAALMDALGNAESRWMLIEREGELYIVPSKDAP